MNQYKWILPLIAIIGIVVVLFSVISSEEATIDQIQRIEIEELKRENKSLIQTNDLLDSKVELLELLKDSLVVLITSDKDLLARLKQNRNEKVNAIGGFTDDELFRLFSGLNPKDTTDRQ